MITLPNMKWSELHHMQIGRYAEYYAKMEFASHGFDVYTSEVDNHGIDFICKNSKNEFLEIQVKSARTQSTKYVFMSENNFDIKNNHLYVALLLFKDDYEPEIYLICATEWQNTNDLLKVYGKNNDKAEYGINLSNKNMTLLDNYKFSNIIKAIK